MGKRNNVEPTSNQIDALLIIGAVIIASTGYDGWGWLVFILICRQ